MGVAEPQAEAGGCRGTARRCRQVPQNCGGQAGGAAETVGRSRRASRHCGTRPSGVAATATPADVAAPQGEADGRCGTAGRSWRCCGTAGRGRRVPQNHETRPMGVAEPQDKAIGCRGTIAKPTGVAAPGTKLAGVAAPQDEGGGRCCAEGRGRQALRHHRAKPTGVAALRTTPTGVAAPPRSHEPQWHRSTKPMSRSDAPRATATAESRRQWQETGGNGRKLRQRRNSGLSEDG